MFIQWTHFPLGPWTHLGRDFSSSCTAGAGFGGWTGVEPFSVIISSFEPFGGALDLTWTVVPCGSFLTLDKGMLSLSVIFWSLTNRVMWDGLQPRTSAAFCLTSSSLELLVKNTLLKPKSDTSLRIILDISSLMNEIKKLFIVLSPNKLKFLSEEFSANEFKFLKLKEVCYPK